VSCLALGREVCFLIVAGEGLFCAKVWGVWIKRKMLLIKMPDVLKKIWGIVTEISVLIN
jgi:hypothetical protein